MGLYVTQFRLGCDSRLYGILGDYPYIYANITLIDAHSAELTSLATLRQYYTPTVVRYYCFLYYYYFKLQILFECIGCHITVQIHINLELFGSLQLVKATSDMNSHFYGIVVDLEVHCIPHFDNLISQAQLLYCCYGHYQKQNNISDCSSESVSGNNQQSLDHLQLLQRKNRLPPCASCYVHIRRYPWKIHTIWNRGCSNRTILNIIQFPQHFLYLFIHSITLQFIYCCSAISAMELDYRRDVMYIYGVYIDDPVVRLYNLTLDRPVFHRVRLDMGIFNQVVTILMLSDKHKISFPSYYNSKDGLLYNIAQAGSPEWPSLYLVAINPLTGKISALGSSLPFIQVL